MYARLNQLRALSAAEDSARPARPVILCEYSHSMGNSTGNLHAYWEAFESDRRMQGGFIWDWADQALVKREKGPDGKEVILSYFLEVGWGEGWVE